MIIGLDPPTPDTNPEVQMLRPVGSIIKLYVNEDPASLLGFGVWRRTSQGRFEIALNESDIDFNVPGGTGGSKAQALMQEETGVHNHTGSGSMGSHMHNLGTISNSSGSHLHTVGLTLGSNVGAPGGSTTAVAAGMTNTSAAGGHTHNIAGETSAAGGNIVVTVSPSGDGQPHNNMPPYITVYIWRRVS